MYIGNTLDRDLNTLMAHTELSDELNINPKTIRPCVAKIWRSGFKKGSILDRSLACSILASELLILDFNHDRVAEQLKKWNKHNIPPMAQLQIQSTFRTAIRKAYNYSCNHFFLQDFCIGEELCSWSKAIAKKKRYNYRVFFPYKWQHILSNVSKLIYWLALPEIEKRRHLPPSSKLYVSHREIAKYAGISTRYIKKALEQLSSYGLIDYKPGTARKWEKNATEVRRIFPIPKPPPKALLKMTHVYR